MYYNNNLNARFRLDPPIEITNENYVAQRRMLLSKNEHGFADKKRSVGDNARNYNDDTFYLIYPYFKTPTIDENELLNYTHDSIQNTPPATLRNQIMLRFRNKLGTVMNGYDFEFANLEVLFTDYQNRPQERQEIMVQVEEELKRLVGRFFKADQKEKLLNETLSYRRATLYRQLLNPLPGENPAPYPVSRPFYEVKGLYEGSDLWDMFKKMPKMGMLHMHTSASVSAQWIIDTLIDDADHNHINYGGEAYIILGDDHRTRGKLTFNRPAGGAFAPLSRDLLYVHNGGALGRELVDLLSFNSDRINQVNYIWDEFNTIFSKTGDLLDNPKFYLAYYTEAFKNLVDDNIEYLELRSGFGKFKKDDGTVDETKFLDLLKQAEAAALQYAVGQNKQFKLRIILCGNRGKSRKFDIFKKMIKAAKWANTDYKDLIIGFDAVSEEDRGLNTSAYSKFIIDSKIYKILNFYFHDGETNWEFNSNIIDAFLLSNRRIGHGFGLNKFPQLTDELAFEQNTPTHKPAEEIAATGGDNVSPAEYIDALENMARSIPEEHLLDNAKCNRLMEMVTAYLGGHTLTADCDSETRGLALEICPISNQMLRYTPDLRLHPANALMHKGIQCVLANDDPQIFGNIGLTYDFISAALAWDLDIYQIKQLIVNSIVYSAIPRRKEESTNPYYDDVITALNRFNVLWHKFLIEQVEGQPAIDEYADDFGGYRQLISDDDYVLREDCIAVDNRYIAYIDG